MAQAEIIALITFVLTIGGYIEMRISQRIKSNQAVQDVQNIGYKESIVALNATTQDLIEKVSGLISELKGFKDGWSHRREGDS